MPTDLSVAPLSDAEFSDLLIRALPGAGAFSRLAVAVSGGGDSLALLHLLSRWSVRVKGPELHALTVDHGLRRESAAEAKGVAAQVSTWPRVQHQILRWRGEKPSTRIMEVARAARYDLMAAYCARHRISHLLLAHHLDDQAETVLMRILKGTGVDGLAAMAPVQMREGLSLVRPLLSVSHVRLLATLREAGISWIEDPSNRNSDYLRPRLREMLAAEGMDPSHLALTARRAGRARAALEAVTDQVWAQQVRTDKKEVLEISCADFDALPEEIRIRFLLRAMALLGAGPSSRLDRVEAAVLRLSMPGRLTLGGCLFSRGAKILRIRPEKA